jgi:hypothetical protein
MPLVLNLDDFDVFDFTETVTYTVYDPEGGTTADSTVTALFITQTANSVLGEMVGTLKRVECHVRANTLAGVVPAMGDRVTRADGRVYVVLPDGVQLATDETRWQLTVQLMETV